MWEYVYAGSCVLDEAGEGEGATAGASTKQQSRAEQSLLLLIRCCNRKAYKGIV